jgi:GR25 family glycosyltransferase involved in LPS biosynthesis
MKISLITACKNRVDALKISLMSWLNFEEIHEIIITDWSSDEPLNYLTEIDSRIKVIRVSDKQYFNQPQPLNLAAKIATGDYILKVDSDHIFNSYYNGIKKYLPKEGEFTCGSLNFDNPEFYDENTQEYYVDNSYFFNVENRKKYVYAYSPIFRYLVGILFVKKEYFDSVGGYNENLGDCYAFEDEEICNRLELCGLKKRCLDLDFYFIHLPHPDKKRIENFKGFESQYDYEQEIRKKLSSMYSGDELEWQIEYALSEKHVNVNKDKFSKITNHYAETKSHWNITQVDDQNYCAVEVEDKLDNIWDEFPSVYCVSLEECQDRRNKITSQFNNYGIEPKFLISKRYSESNDKTIGKYLHTLNDGTKGCCVSHLKAIKEWYYTTDEEYAFFCEDDLSLETVDYWDFTWNEFIEKIPDDVECVQLLTIRNDYDTFEMRPRYWDDWGATAYILTREGAKKIIDAYIFEDVYSLEVPNKEIMPLIENIIFSFVNTHTIPLFVENISFKSTFENQDDDVKNGQKNNHKIAHDIVLNMWKTKKQVSNKSEKIKEIIVVEKTELEKLLESYSLDTENPEHNFNLGVWYENQGHTAPALSYFLRCAERGFESDPNLAYEALIRGSSCYFKQGTRDGSGRGMLWQAQMFLPKRPEAYYLLARYAAKNEWWQDCYSTSELCLLNCDFNLSPLRTDVEYSGKCGLLFQKAISGWWWGKVEESKSLLIEILNNYQLNESDRQIILDNLEKMGVNDIEFDNFNNFVYPDNFNWSDLSYEDIITIQREVVSEKVYRFWEDVKEGDIVLDIGASVGAYTISIMNQNPKKVYCVEPSKKLLNVLLENCSLKSENLITTINYGIVDCIDDKINIFGGEDEFSPITFKTMIDQYKIDHINYMKVDCEGGEYSIFKDENIEFLKNKVDFIAMEMHLNYSDCREKFKEFRDKYLIQFENYKVMSCTRQNISWGNSIDLKDEIFDNNFIDNYSCEFMIYIKNR